MDYNEIYLEEKIAWAQLQCDLEKLETYKLFWNNYINQVIKILEKYRLNKKA